MTKAKMKKASILLTALLITLIAVMVSLGMISVAQSTDVSIDYINISYGVGKIKLQYAVSAAGLPEGATLGVDARVGAPDSAEVRTTENQGVTVIDGKEYTVFGLPVYADELTVDFYATPYVECDGVRTDFELAKDSIIEYASKKKAEIGDENDQTYRLIDSLLEYGTRVQEYFGKNTARPANVDYHKITLVDGKFADGFDHGYFFAGETVTATPVFKPGYTFEKWVDTDGATVSESAAFGVIAGSVEETYTAVLVKSTDNISYVLDGGTLPEGRWTEYPEGEDFLLPIPTKAGYVFSGWFTSPDFDIDGNLTRIPAGSDEFFVLYAKWNKVVAAKDGAAVRNSIKTLCFVYDNAETYGGNGNELAVADGVLTWTQGTVKTSQITFSGNLQSAVGTGKVFTFEFTLAKKADVPCFNSNVRLRRSGINETIEIFNVTSDGAVNLSGGGKIAQLTEDFTTIRIAVDFNNGTRTAYDENGMVIANSGFGIPSSVTSLDEWYDLLTGSYWQWLAGGSAPANASAICIKSFTLNVGNSAERGTGIPVTVVDKAGENNYNIAYDSDSSEARAAADALAALLSKKGLKAPAVIADTASASVNEIVIGEASRAGVAALKSYLAEESKKNPDNYWWAAAYEDGKLYILAEDELGYSAALKYIGDNMFRDGELIVGSELLIAKGKSEDEIFFDSLVDPDPHEAYMSYEIYDNFYEGYDDPFAELYSEYKEMTVTLVDAKTYRISYVDDREGVFSADFVQKKWGMWMMGMMRYTEKNGTVHTITSSSTDYEFVLRCANEGSITFRSGNHADYTMSDWDATDTSKSNDRLLDMTFYDAKSGDAFTLAVGESKKVNGLRIVMHHNVYEQEYAQENVLMNVEKSYLYNGYDVLCDSTLYCTQDVSFNTSYSCMLPISKKYGNCAMFYLEDGSTVFMKTPLSNTADETRMGVNSSHIDLWGEDNPKYHMTVDLFNPEHQLMSSNTSGKGYVGFREMLGGGSNKLYCSMFSNPGMLEYGSEFNYSSRWAFSVQDDFVNPDRAPDFWVGLPK